MGMRGTVILLLAPMILLTWQAASQNSCDPGWFGSLCQYKCRCRQNKCAANGVCTNNASCEGGWFGPACQYADLAFRSYTSARWQSQDGDDKTCLTSSDSDSITVKLNKTYHFSWLRVRLSNPDLLYNVTVYFRRDNSLNCTNKRTSRVDNTTLDIHCDLHAKVNELTLSGAGVPHLCSVYISGGRNLALRQNTTQSSLYELFATSDKAVDGNTDKAYTKKSCSHTEGGKDYPNLNLTLSRPQHVTRYVIYNRSNRRDRLKGFVLTSYSQSLTPVFNYTDRKASAQLVYTVIADNVTVPTYLVNVVATDTREKILTLCELEVYGESACPPGQYGRECEHTCNCAGDQSCFVSTGGCSSGCAAGFQGEDCMTRCDPGRYGLGCQSSCSQFCVRDNDTRTDFCNNTNGACLYGCQDGYQGPTCTEGTSLAFNHIQN
ncbi:unnamed protein product [Candidula unifasciata]|uniref:Fucolectin tachylectin-4 pentraxin-1 domain-containing protein n=1 Tax=Candidula unifasciata TaxID=100452 RepID=A0A8S3ZL50_9EUPU|nr:unnamed protein product [Candidula unifasciata]